MILISACLLGCCCRYDGGHNYIKELGVLVGNNNTVSICPEQEGGMSTPRIACEINQGDNIVVDKNNEDKTIEFTRGAIFCLEKLNIDDIELAILKARSPSCGFGEIYNGLFEGKLISGNGIFAHLLNKKGIKIYNENNFMQSDIVTKEINK